MISKKCVVYDSQNYFSRFLKYEFRKTMKFDSYKNFEQFENVITDYSIIVFVIYLEEELFDFMKIHKKEVPMIVCTFNKNLLMKMQNFDEILLLDTSKIKSEVITEFKSYLHLVRFYSTIH